MCSSHRCKVQVLGNVFCIADVVSKSMIVQVNNCSTRRPAGVRSSRGFFGSSLLIASKKCTQDLGLAQITEAEQQRDCQ